MATVKRSVYLISEEQRNALLNYLKGRPYQEVATGVQFLLNAPTAQIDVEVPGDHEAQMSAPEKENAVIDIENTKELAMV